ncbi:base excision DNA repair protein [Silvibacterium acidisoli]|uniref:base excision DNA repair protein n=1 Tax=Acidobacteriaceae bacterium ZG23-2 TaxID=2883246 RepID=UPI00406CCA38
MTPAARLRRLYHRLLAAYGPQQWWPAQTPFEVVIGAYLTQNTSWLGVERSIQNLVKNNLLTAEAIRAVPIETLREHIRPSGYMIRKAAALKAFVAFLDEHYSGSIEKLAADSPEVARERLLALPGVGPETADAILLYALHQPAFVVDEYLRRIVTRHGLVHDKAKYSEIQRLAVSSFRRDKAAERPGHYNEFHALIVNAGKLHCGPKPRCESCPLAFDLERPVNITRA